jgi:hypothetical protein
MTDLTDFLNVVASAEDWAGFGADGREPEEPMKRLTIDMPDKIHRRVRGRLRQAQAKAVDHCARCWSAISRASEQFRLPL